VSERKSVWNIVALVVTLGLAAVVAIVAATRGENTAASPGASASPSATPSGSASPGGLNGDGPYVVYAGRSAVFAYDIASGATVSLGSLDGDPASEPSRQPGSGRIVAFPTTDGSVWSVKRSGMTRVGTIPADAGDGFEGAAVSPDDRRIAVGVLTPDPATVLVDLQSGHSTLVKRTRRGSYPPEALLPVAWSGGGGLIYEIPYCRCGGGTPGLYSVDADTGASTIVNGTRSTSLFTFAVASSGQSVFYGEGTPRRCDTGEEGPCTGQPFFLRRIASGQRGVETLRRATDASFGVRAISQNGGLLLVTRLVSPNSTEVRTEVYGPNGDREPPIRGIPESATPIALLPRNVVIASTATPFTIAVVTGGRAATIVRSDEEAPIYLGWLS
jgi:hypothetical protein